MSAKPRLILDMDVGVDDAEALVMALHAHRTGAARVEAIMLAAGNTSLENVARNTMRVLQTVGMEEEVE